MTSLALIGGQYGSEGKGVIAAGLAGHFQAAVRTGGPNAGHSFFYRRKLYKMRQVPCAWISPRTTLFIGAGAVIDPGLLEEEAERVGRMVFVDPQATIVMPYHHHAEQSEGLRNLIGSTTEGVGKARIDKIGRNGKVTLAKDYRWDSGMVAIENVAMMLEEVRESDGLIMLEGTQGSALSLHHGRYPYVTSADTNAAQLAADAGIPPSDVEHTHLVIRTFPIRVAGNSGDTGAEEIGWERFVEAGLVKQPERTTVTNNVRRIFDFSRDDVQRAIRLNDPCGVWLTFGDYLDPRAPGINDIDELMDGPVGDWVRDNITPLGVRLLGVGVGGDYWRVVETGDSCFRPGRHHSMTWPLDHTINEEVMDALPF